jgi:hypothetical protein
MWSLNLREEHKSQVIENKLLRKIYGPKRDEIRFQFKMSHKTKLSDL